MSIIERAITIVITAGANSGVTFGPQKQNTLTLAGYRVSASIDYPGGASTVSAEVSVYGMNNSDMNALASLGQLNYANNLNTITILAGDADSGMSIAFQGILQSAVVNTAGSPKISFDMTAYGFYDIALTPVPPSSFGGAASVATIMAQLAELGGFGFENNGITAVLSNPYFPGDVISQIKACARHANINYFIDPTKGVNGTLAIWPKNGYRGGAAVPVAPPPDGTMIGYPRYTQYGVDVDMLFNPNLLFGGLIKLTSSLQPACGTWAIYTLSHFIESITPNGDWMTTISCWSPSALGTATGNS